MDLEPPKVGGELHGTDLVIEKEHISEGHGSGSRDYRGEESGLRTRKS